MWQHYEVVQYGYDIEKLRKDLVEEETLSRQLRLEFETVHAPQDLEKRARRSCTWRRPRRADTLVLESVPATTAGKGIVAAVR